MKKLLFVLSLLLGASIAKADTATDLMRLGLPAETASYIATITQTAIDGNGGIVFKADDDAQRKLVFDGSSDTALTLKFGDGTAAQTLSFSGSSADAADSQTLNLSGGGAVAADGTRGAALFIRGNEFTSTGGSLSAILGDTTTANLNLIMENASSNVIIKDLTTGNLWTFTNGGNLAQDGTNGGSIVLSKASTSVREPAANALTAAGSARTDCLALTAVYNNVTTAAASTGVCLWGGVAGTRVRVRNGGANDLKVYPNSGSATINGGTGGAGITIASSGNHVADCVATATDTWICTDAASAS